VNFTFQWNDSDENAKLVSKKSDEKSKIQMARRRKKIPNISWTEFRRWNHKKDVSLMVIDLPLEIEESNSFGKSNLI
jgi:hypothetical protein